MLHSFSAFINSSNFITLLVLLVLLVYLFLVFWIFTYKYKQLTKIQLDQALELDLLGQNNGVFNPHSMIGKFFPNPNLINKDLLEVARVKVIKRLSSYMTWLSITSSTAPFIGLFGTVVGILESFAKFADVQKVSFSSIAPAISHALIATAAGIFVAIFAYTFHQIISRKLYEIDSSISSQIMIIASKL